VAEPERERCEQRDQDQLLAEGVFVLGGRGEAGKRVVRRVENATQAGLALVRIFF